MQAVSLQEQHLSDSVNIYTKHSKMSTGISGLVDSLTPTVSGSEMYKKHPFSGADSGTEDSSHLEATHTTQNTLDNLLSNPLAFQVPLTLSLNRFKRVFVVLVGY